MQTTIPRYVANTPVIRSSNSMALLIGNAWGRLNRLNARMLGLRGSPARNTVRFHTRAMPALGGTP